MTIKELLQSMLTKEDIKNNTLYLPNTIETWRRIGNKDLFSELGFLSESEKETFLSEWIDNNPYNH